MKFYNVTPNFIEGFRLVSEKYTTVEPRVQIFKFGTNQFYIGHFFKENVDVDIRALTLIQFC